MKTEKNKKILKIAILILIINLLITNFIARAETNWTRNKYIKDDYVIKINFEKSEKNIKKSLDLKRKRERLKSGWYQITGYQAVAGQTDSTPFLAAWNDNIKDAINVVAVVQNSGIRRGTCVEIAGFKRRFIVLDYFNKKYNGLNKIDVLVNTKKEALRITSKRKVTFYKPGSCKLLRMVNGKIREETLRKERFKY